MHSFKQLQYAGDDITFGHLLLHILSVLEAGGKASCPANSNSLTDEAQCFLNYYEAKISSMWNLLQISWGERGVICSLDRLYCIEKDPILKVDILTFIPKGRTSEKAEGKRRRRCHIARVILLVKAKLTATTLLLLLIAFYDSKSVPTCHGFRRYIRVAKNWFQYLTVDIIIIEIWFLRFVSLFII